MLGTQTYASFPSDSSSTFRRLSSTQALFRRDESDEIGTTVVVRSSLPSAFAEGVYVFEQVVFELFLLGHQNV